MVELPEAITFAGQCNATLRGKRILRGQAGQSPHKFAFFHGDPALYADILAGKTVGDAWACGGKWVTALEPGWALILGDGGEKVTLHQTRADFPKKHQLLLEFEDGTGLSVTVSGWGFLQLVPADEVMAALGDNSRKPSALDAAFTPEYFMGLVQGVADKPAMSVKEFLAAGQRIPGLGNGCLQDILLRARVHPRQKVNGCTQAELLNLYESIITTLREMTEMGSRDTETDLFGAVGGYPKRLDARSLGQPCPQCGAPIQKIAFMGGACYVCEECKK